MSPGVRENAVRFPRQRVRLPYPRSKSGCLVCRRQHKKCDERRPVCSRCLAKGKDCQWPVTVQREADFDKSPSFNDAQSPIREGPSNPSPRREEPFSPTSTSNDAVGFDDEGLRLPAPPGCSLGSVSSMFLAHFVSETSKYMTTVSPEKNPFLTHILPLAFSDELIFHSLLVLGGAHLESRRVSPEINTWVCRHYGRVIHLLQDIISRKSNESIDWLRAFLALLMLYLFGVCPLPPIQSISSKTHAERVTTPNSGFRRMALITLRFDITDLTLSSLGFQLHASWRCNSAYSSREENYSPTAECFVENE
jgi:hypothetical protein